MDHPLEVWGVDSVLDEPAGERGPLGGLAAVDGQTRLGILVLGILQVARYFLVHTEVESGSDHMKFRTFFFFSFSVEADLDDGGEVLSTDVVLCLHVQVTQLTGSHGVVLGVEFVETLEGLSSLHRSNQEKREGI